MTHPGHKQGDDGDGRSPGSRVIALAGPAFPVSQWHAIGPQALRLQLRGQPRTWSLQGYAAPCSLLLPFQGEPSPSAWCTGAGSMVKRLYNGGGSPCRSGPADRACGPGIGGRCLPAPASVDRRRPHTAAALPISRGGRRSADGSGSASSRTRTAHSPATTTGRPGQCQRRKGTAPAPARRRRRDHRPQLSASA